VRAVSKVVSGALSAATLAVVSANRTVWQAWFLASACCVCQAKAGQSHADHAEAEFLQRLPPGYGLGHAFGEVIEFVIHTFPF